MTVHFPEPECHTKIWVAIFFPFRNQIEVDLRENHPFFDTPLFLVGRESKLRKVCAMIVNAKYNYVLRDPITGKEIKSKYKQFQ